MTDVEIRQAGLRRRYSMKAGLVIAGIISACLGLALAGIFLLDLRAVVDALRIDALLSWFEGAVRTVLGWVGVDSADVGDAFLSMTSIAIAVALNIAVFVLAIGIAVGAGLMAGRQAARQGEFSPFGRTCVALTRNTELAGLLIAASGLALGVLGLLFCWKLWNVGLILRLFPAIVGVGLALLAFGIATMFRLDYLFDDRKPFAGATPEPFPRDKARLTGRELLDRLRQSPIYRRQVFCDRDLPRFPLNRGEKGALLNLVSRYPRIASLLPKTGISELTSNQARALRAILESEKQPQRSVDHVFVGFPGSGRTTLANLVSLAAVLHREGAMYCVTPESPTLSVDPGSAGSAAHPGARHPSLQFNQWVQDIGMNHQVRVQEAYDDPSGPGDLDFRLRPDVVFTDVRMLSQTVLARVRGDARELIARLRYVVIDHPNRLPREDLIRLRLAIARLRMTAEMLGRAPTFILILPPILNYEEFAKFLLNNDDVPFHNFVGWCGEVRLVGWVPPLELLDIGENERPLVVRSSFTHEALALLTEIGYLSNRLREEAGGAERGDLRVAIVDSKPLLGPEAREHIRKEVLFHLGREVPKDQAEFRIHLDWSYLSTNDLAINCRSAYDAIIVLGVGGHPEHLVSSLRAAVADEGALLLMGDCSPVDQESLKTIAEPDWDPLCAISDFRRPSFLLPDHSEAVIAHEMACLFEDFHDRPLPRERMLEVFPGERTADLLRAWETLRNIEPVSTFECVREGDRPVIRPYLRRCDPSFSGGQYEVPWGCSSRRIFRIYDTAALRDAARRPHQNNRVDFDRLFIDYFPQAMRRYSPATVMVEGWARRELAPADQEALRRRAVECGTITLVQPDEELAVRIDRRAARFDATLVSERSLQASHGGADAGALGPDRQDAIIPFLRAENGLAIADGLRRPNLPEVVKPLLRLSGGVWVCRVREDLRNVVHTSERLIEDAGLTGFFELPRTQRATREYECLAASLFLSRTGGATTDLPWDSRPAWHGLARAMQRVLAGRYLNFDTEMRISLVPNAPDDATTPTRCGEGYRVLVYGLHGDELGGRHGLDWLFDSRRLDEMVRKVHQRLEDCDCDDGCSACCGGLGTIPEGRLPMEGYEARDAVSRRGAYLLACGVLGRPADWDAYFEGQRRRRSQGPGGAGPATTDAELDRLVTELLGTADATGTLRGGTWSTLFGERMVLSKAFLAPASWSSAMPPQVAGLYYPGSNEVHILTGLPADSVREVIIHEYTHNWQFRAEPFDLERLRLSPEALQFFEGKLVIEGHATWADHQFRFFKGLGASYSPSDGRKWNEYKVGYFLFENIEKAIGQAGLFAWLRKDPGSAGTAIRSRHSGLKYPFSLTEALQAFKLERAARTGRFTDFDVPDDVPQE